MWTFFLNPTNWLVVAAALAALWAGPRALDLPITQRRWARRSALVLLVAVSSLATAAVAARLVVGYSAPGAYAEEVAAARLILEGRAIAGNERAAIREWTTEEQISHEWLAGGLTACQAGAADGRAELFTSQGHPPFLVAASVPVVAMGGGRALFVATSVVALVLLAFAGWLLVSELVPAPRPWQRVLAISAIAGWQPVLAGLRQGDAALMAAALLVIAWAALRRGRTAVAGLPLGGAASLSSGALILLPGLVFFQPRAALVALAVAGAGLVFAVAVAGTAILGVAADASYRAALTYAPAVFNYSLLGRTLSGSWSTSLTAASLALLCVAAIRTARAGRTAPVTPHTIAPAVIPLFCCFAVLCAPVSWSQQLAVLLLPLAVLLATTLRAGSRPGLVAWSVLALLVALPDPVVRGAAYGSAALTQVDLSHVPPLPLLAALAIATWVGTGHAHDDREAPDRSPRLAVPGQPTWADQPGAAEP